MQPSSHLSLARCEDSAVRGALHRPLMVTHACRTVPGWLPKHLPCHPTSCLWVPCLEGEAREHSRSPAFEPLAPADRQPTAVDSPRRCRWQPHAASCELPRFPELASRRGHPQAASRFRLAVKLVAQPAERTADGADIAAAHLPSVWTSIPIQQCRWLCWQAAVM